MLSVLQALRRRQDHAVRRFLDHYADSQDAAETPVDLLKGSSTGLAVVILPDHGLKLAEDFGDLLVVGG